MAETPARYCGNCGNELGPEDQFCENCGTPVHQAATVPTPEADVPVPPPPQQAGGGAAPPPQADGSQRSWPRRHPFLTGCLGLLAVLLLFIFIIIAIVLASGGNDSNKSGGGGAPQKNEQPAATPSSTPSATPTPTPSATPAAGGVSTANMTDAAMATDENGDNPTDVFAPKDTFYCVGHLENAPDDTTITAVWIASDIEGVEPNTKIKQITARGGSGLFRFNLTNDGPWPTGKYEVDLYLNDAEDPTKALEFEVR